MIFGRRTSEQLACNSLVFTEQSHKGSFEKPQGGVLWTKKSLEPTRLLNCKPQIYRVNGGLHL